MFLSSVFTGITGRHAVMKGQLELVFTPVNISQTGFIFVK